MSNAAASKTSLSLRVVAKITSNFVLKLAKGSPLPAFHASFEAILADNAVTYEMSTGPRLGTESAVRLGRKICLKSVKQLSF